MSIPTFNPARFTTAPKVEALRQLADQAFDDWQETEAWVAELQYRQRRHDLEDAELDRERNDYPKVDYREALAWGSGSGKRIRYWPDRPSDDEIAEAVKAEQAARAEYQRATKAWQKTSDSAEPWDPVAACRQTGTRWFANRRLTLAGRTYQRGEPIERAVWEALPFDKRDGLTRSRRIEEIPA